MPTQKNNENDQELAEFMSNLPLAEQLLRYDFLTPDVLLETIERDCQAFRQAWPDGGHAMDTESLNRIASLNADCLTIKILATPYYLTDATSFQEAANEFAGLENNHPMSRRSEQGPRSMQAPLALPR